jgi:hypothetical protein
MDPNPPVTRTMMTTVATIYHRSVGCFEFSGVMDIIFLLSRYTSPNLHLFYDDTQQPLVQKATIILTNKTAVVVSSFSTDDVPQIR